MGVNDVTTNRNTGFWNELFHGGPTVSVNAGASEVPEGAAINTDDLMKTLKNPKVGFLGLGGHIDDIEGVHIPDGMGQKMADTLQAKQDAFDQAKTDYANELKNDPDLGPDSKAMFEGKIKQAQNELDQYKVNCQNAIKLGGQMQDAQDTADTRAKALSDYSGADPETRAALQKDCDDANNQVKLLGLQFQAVLNTCAPTDPGYAAAQQDLQSTGYEPPPITGCVPGAVNNPALETVDPNALASNKAAVLASDIGNHPRILAQLQSLLNIPATGVLDATTIQAFNTAAQNAQAGVTSSAYSNEMGGAAVAQAELNAGVVPGSEDPNVSQEITNSNTIAYLQGQIANLLQQNAQLSGNTAMSGRYTAISG